MPGPGRIVVPNPAIKSDKIGLVGLDREYSAIRSHHPRSERGVVTYVRADVQHGHSRFHERANEVGLGAFVVADVNVALHFQSRF